VRHRPAAATPAGDGAGRSELTAGLRVVFGDRTLRAYVLLLWVGCAFTFAAEGLVVPLAGQYGGGSRTGGLLLAAAPLGGIVGTVLLTRLCGPARRQRLILPLAVLSCAALLPIALHPPLWLVIVLLAAAGVCNSYCVPLNPMFARAVPNRYRARAFGVAISGLCAAQGVAMVAAGALADHVTPTTVVAGSGLVGTVAIVVLAARWPRPAAAGAAPAPAADLQPAA
jgi:predicted MFS family arabinose efflux permease